MDLALTSNGDLPGRLKLVDGADAIAQRVGRRLKTHLGEVLADSSRGNPWNDWLLTRPFPLDAASAWLRASIESCPGVIRLDDWSGAQDGRTVTFTGSILTASGSIAIELLPLGAPGAPNTSASFRLVTGPGRLR